MAFPAQKSNSTKRRSLGIVSMVPRIALAIATFSFVGQLSTFSTLASEVEGVRAPLKVTVDRAKIVRIAKSADTIIIGNPAIVDATIQDARTLILTGRSYGVTNLIVLDSNGDPVVDETVVVQSHETNTVRIYRREVRETLACSPVCEPTLTIGDNAAAFTATRAQITSRNGLSDSNANR